MIDSRIIAATLEEHARALAALREELRHVRIIQVAHASHQGQKRRRAGRCTYCGATSEQARERTAGESWAP